MTESAVVLVVEDNPSFRKFLRYFFLNEGFQVITAPSPEKALEVLQKTPEIEAAYIDVHYENSRMTGFEVAAKIKTTKGIDFPFVVMSTNDNQANQQNSKELGAVAFVDKHYESMKASTEYLREFLGNLHGPFPYKIFNLNDSFR